MIMTEFLLCKQVKYVFFRTKRKFAYLTLSILGKISKDDTFKYLSYFFHKTGFEIPCVVSLGDNVHEMSLPIYSGKKKQEQKHIINLRLWNLH